MQDLSLSQDHPNLLLLPHLEATDYHQALRMCPHALVCRCMCTWCFVSGAYQRAISSDQPGVSYSQLDHITLMSTVARLPS